MSCCMKNSVDPDQLKKPADLGLHCFTIEFISEFMLFLKSLCMVINKMISWVLCALSVHWDKSNFIAIYLSLGKYKILPFSHPYLTLYLISHKQKEL